jgi:hypothetical protein
MDSTNLISTGQKIAITSFVGGTLIVLLFYSTNEVSLALFGLAYVIIVGIINLIILVQIIYKTYRDKANKRKLFKTAGLMLLNIPVLILYCWFAIILANTVRITFVNDTSTQLDNVKIDGCEEKHIDKLNVGESKTVWVHIPGDCGVSITYKLNGQIKTEDVTGYVTNDNGYIMTFKIGTNQKPYDKEL